MLIGIVVTIVVFFGLGFFIQFLGRQNILWSIVPANTFAFVTHTSERNGDMTEGGGSVVDIIHGVPGMKINKEDINPQEWYFESGEEDRGLLFYILGVTWIGPFKTLRWNKLKKFRYTHGERGDEYHIMPKDDIVRFVPFSGEQAVEIKDAETKSVFGVDLVFNIIQEKKYPLKSVLRVADSNAVLTTMIHERVIMVTSMHEPEALLSEDSKNKSSLIQAADNADEEALREIGTHMTRVTLISVSVSEEDRKLFELKEKNEREGDAAIVRAKKEAEATIERAEGDKKAKILMNEADSDQVERVVKPSAENDRTVAVVQALAYRDNKHVIAVGGTPLINLPTK
ncbi:MAG: SPFH domain-containing protein [Minisyncoccota bacterium]